PPIDPWTAWFDELAALCPSQNTRLMQLETAAGLRATASLARFTARFEGNSADSDRWVHGVQPAWSLDILWIPFREVAIYRSFAPNGAPLSQISPRQVKHESALAGPPKWQVDRSVTGAPLRSAAQEFGFGFGVAGGTELSFGIPPGAYSLQTSFC